MVLLAVLFIVLGVASMHVAVSMRKASSFNVCVSSVEALACLYAGNKFALPMLYVVAAVASVSMLLGLVEMMICGSGAPTAKTAAAAKTTKTQ